MVDFRALLTPVGYCNGGSVTFIGHGWHLLGCSAGGVGGNLLFSDHTLPGNVLQVTYQQPAAPQIASYNVTEASDLYIRAMAKIAHSFLVAKVLFRQAGRHWP